VPGRAQLNELLKVITDHYIEKGLVTSRAYLPQQDLSGGHLKVLVVEGRLEGLKGAQGSQLSERELGMAFPASAVIWSICGKSSRWWIS
jgi:hemolysin activation/secretion protein